MFCKCTNTRPPWDKIIIWKEPRDAGHGSWISSYFPLWPGNMLFAPSAVCHHLCFCIFGERQKSRKREHDLKVDHKNWNRTCPPEKNWPGLTLGPDLFPRTDCATTSARWGLQINSPYEKHTTSGYCEFIVSSSGRRRVILLRVCRSCCSSVSPLWNKRETRFWSMRRSGQRTMNTEVCESSAPVLIFTKPAVSILVYTNGGSLEWPDSDDWHVAACCRLWLARALSQVGTIERHVDWDQSMCKLWYAAIAHCAAVCRSCT